VALIDLERAMVALCFRAAPTPEELAQLGDVAGFQVYRELVRERLGRELRAALPRSHAAVPAELFERTFVWHLEHRPPRSRYFRDVVPEFVDSALPLWAAEASLPSHCSDLLRYELALWEVADLEHEPGLAPLELAFDRVPIASPALRLLALEHTVQLKDIEHTPTWLCVHRAADSDRPRTYRLNQTTHGLLSRLCSGSETVTESVNRLAAEQGTRIDARYVDGLCEALAQFLELGILLGSR
jgi:hypothetical protein